MTDLAQFIIVVVIAACVLATWIASVSLMV